MLLLIDGYNLLKNIHKVSRVTEQQLDQFKLRLSQYAKLSGNEVILIFDGGSDWYPSKEVDKKITIIYSGIQESADDLIKEYLQRLKGRDVLLVSTDRALDVAAHNVGIEYVDSDEFYVLMEQRLEKKRVIHTNSSQSRLVRINLQKNTELDNLMEEASRSIISKDEKIEQARKGTTQKLSKKERKKKGKLDKV